MGGNGSGGGKRSGGGGGSAGVTERFVDSYTRGTSVKFTESDSKNRVTVSDTKERITTTLNRAIDHQTKSNGDGTATRTTIFKGSQGNLYAVDITYRIGGTNSWTSGVRRVKKK